MTATFSFGQFQIGGSGGSLILPNQLRTDLLQVESASGTFTFNILGSGGISASASYFLSRKDSPTGSNSTPQVDFHTTNLRLSSDAIFYLGDMTSVGYPSQRTTISSFTVSTPTNVLINNSQISNTTITDIVNLGPPQYAYSTQNNTLTRTTGFLTSDAAGGSGGSFTYVS
jgi:hypothetical protein